METDDRLHISTQLINVPDGDHLWSQHYDRESEKQTAISISTGTMEALRRIWNWLNKTAKPPSGLIPNSWKHAVRVLAWSLSGSYEEKDQASHNH